MRAGGMRIEEWPTTTASTAPVSTIVIGRIKLTTNKVDLCLQAPTHTRTHARVKIVTRYIFNYLNVFIHSSALQSSHAAVGR